MEKSINPIYADIDPESILLFDRTIQNHLASTIHLTNTCPYSILYKLKLTASRSYIAQPPFGLLRPAHSMDVNVLITPLGYKSQSEIAQDKFLLTVVPCNQEPDDSSAADPVYMKTLWDVTLPNSQPQIKKFTGKIQVDMETYLNLCSLNSDLSPTGPIYIQARPESVISFGYMPKGIGTAQIELASVYHQTVLFKIKTTSPKKFIVKPYFGVLHPGQSITADIVMQFNEDELEGTRKIDKFLLSVIPYDEGLTSSRLTSYDFFNLEWDRMSVQPNLQIQGTHFLVKVVKSDIKSARTYNTESSKGI